MSKRVMQKTLEKADVTLVQEHILRTLLYFDIFNYPLKTQEIFRFLGTNHINSKVVGENLEVLVRKNIIYQFDDFFSLRNELNIIDRRRKGNLRAEALLPLAQKQARLISQFPFVRAVMASGSLSKGYMDETSDLDFFIVTAPGKLWIARTLLILYKRIFLFNSHRYFCVNYFVDSEHLTIEEKNLFTATELATVIPLYNGEGYKEMHYANGWVKNFFPNYCPRDLSNLVHQHDHKIKKSLEKCLSFFSGRLDKIFMDITLKRWERLYQKNHGDSDFRIAFKTTKYASKNHPRNYQRKVMDLYNEKLAEFSMNHHIPWRP